MTSTPLTAAAAPPAAVLLVGPSVGNADGRLDFSKCLSDAATVYRRNVFVLVVAAFLTDVLSVITLGILVGPLFGGWCLMTINALTRPDRKVDLGLLFSGSYRFGALVVVVILSTLAQAAGLAMFVVPGLLVLTVWLFPFHLVVDKGLGPLDALNVSARIVCRRGIGPNFMLAVLVFLLVNLPAFHPILWPVKWVASPLGWLLVSAAYIQEVRDSHVSQPDFLPRGFPVQPVAADRQAIPQEPTAAEFAQKGDARA